MRWLFNPFTGKFDAAPPAGAVCIIGQARIPLVFVSSGSMGNNGALTLTTALNVVIPKCFVYLPAGAIASGSAAGWYYAVFSSTTVATVYNNAYTSGATLAPASPTAFVTTGPGAYTQTSGSYVTAFSVPILGGRVDANGGVRATFITACNNNSNFKEMRAWYGAFLLAQGVMESSVNARFDTGFTNAGATNRQAPFGNGSMTGGISTTAIGNGSVDSTADQNLFVQIATGADTDWIALQSATIELLPAA